MVNPGVVVGHPFGAFSRSVVRGLGRLPKVVDLSVLVGPNRVGRPLALHIGFEDLDRFGEDGTGGRSADVLVAAVEHDGRAEQEHDGREKVSKPETDVLLGEDHGNLSENGTNVDEHVEIHVDGGDCESRILDNTLTGREGLDGEPGLLVLFGDQRRNVGLETTSSHTHNYKTDGEAGDSTVRGGDDRGDGRNDENTMTNERQCDGVHDSPVTSEILIGNVGADEGHNVRPERVDYKSLESLLSIS